MREELARAATMLDLGRYEEASTLLARLVSAEPGSGRAWCLFARAHLGADRFAEAVEAANRAAAIEPAEEWPHRLASNALMHLGNHGQALRAAAESRRLAPGYWQTHVCVAQAALAAGQPAIAASAAAEARKLAPTEPDVHFLSGKVALARSDLDGARGHQERALALDPSHSGAMNELGRIRLRRHDTVGAIRHFINAARTTPSEHIYSRNIDVVIVRSVSRMIYIFVLVAVALLWIPAVTKAGRLPLAAGFAALAAGSVATFVIMVTRLPREARQLARRTVLSRRVLTALAVAFGGVAAAFAAVAFVPTNALPQTLPIAIILVIVARVVANGRLRSPLGPYPPGNRTSPTQPLPPTRRRSLGLRGGRPRGRGAGQVGEFAAAPVLRCGSQRDRVRSQSRGTVRPPAWASSASQSSTGTRHRTSNSMPLGSFAYRDFDSRWSLSPTRAPASISLLLTSASSARVPTSQARWYRPTRGRPSARFAAAVSPTSNMPRSWSLAESGERRKAARPGISIRTSKPRTLV
jgi:tetratricopeptide (TPR) repeat protein